MAQAPKDVEIKARVSTWTKQQIEDIAHFRGESVSVIVREALTDYLRKLGLPRPANADTEKGAFAAIRRAGKNEISETAKVSETPSSYGVKAQKKPTKRLAGHFRDIREISLAIFGSIPAGWPDDRAAVKPKRKVKIAKDRFPEGVFGLDVSGESMNAAKGQFGPILDGETVVLLPPDLREPQHGDIVAALCDGQTTLKRLWCKPQPCVLRAESTNPTFKNCIRPAHDLVIQGVVVGKL